MNRRWLEHSPRESDVIHISLLEDEVSMTIQNSLLQQGKRTRSKFDLGRVLRSKEAVLFFEQKVFPKLPEARTSGEVSALTFVQCLVQSHAGLFSDSQISEETVIQLSRKLFEDLKCAHSSRLDYVRLDQLTANQGILGLILLALKKIGSETLQPSLQSQPGSTARCKVPPLLIASKQQIHEFAERLIEKAERQIESAFQRHFHYFKQKQVRLEKASSKIQLLSRRVNQLEQENEQLRRQNQRLRKQPRTRTPELGRQQKQNSLPKEEAKRKKR